MNNFLFATGILVALAGCTAQQKTDVTIDSNMSSSRPTSTKVQSVSSFDEEAYPPLTDLDKQMAEAYIGTNIDAFVTLAPSVLGGKFYTTEIEWYTENTALVSYEDGHISGRARVSFMVNGGTVDVVQFIEFFPE